MGSFLAELSWAVLLLCVGAQVIAAARGNPDSVSRRLNIGLATFWAIHGSYVIAVPMPLPLDLSWLRIPLVAFPATLVALHVGGALAAAPQAQTVRLMN